MPSKVTYGQGTGVLEDGVGWFYMEPKPRPSFNMNLLMDLEAWTHRVNAHEEQIHFHVLDSAVPDIFNLGGDLAYFEQAVQAQSSLALFNYASLCVRTLYLGMNLKSKGDPIVTIALVRGTALGGGFEAALAADVLIAERGVKMGLPEITFNLFPGMGAYSFLSRKIGPKAAEDMILSGKLYTAEALHEMGIVDVLVDEGCGQQQTRAYIEEKTKSLNGFKAVKQLKHVANPVTFAELMDVVDLWVGTALKLSPRDVRFMKMLVSRQNRHI